MYILRTSNITHNLQMVLRFPLILLKRLCKMQKVISNSFRSVWRVAPAAILRKTTPVLRSLNYSLPMYSFSTATPNDSVCDKTCNKNCSECHSRILIIIVLFPRINNVLELSSFY